MTTYYAIKSKQGEYVAFYYSGRYETTDVNESELNIFTAQDILFETYKDAEYELKNIKDDSSYDADGVEIDGIVELDITLIINEIK